MHDMTSQWAVNQYIVGTVTMLYPKEKLAAITIQHQRLVASLDASLEVDKRYWFRIKHVTPVLTLQMVVPSDSISVLSDYLKVNKELLTVFYYTHTPFTQQLLDELESLRKKERRTRKQLCEAVVACKRHWSVSVTPEHLKWIWLVGNQTPNVQTMTNKLQQWLKQQNIFEKSVNKDGNRSDEQQSGAMFQLVKRYQNDYANDPSFQIIYAYFALKNEQKKHRRPIDIKL
ncbi:hypothetical protein MM326_11630 [Alkalihalobacillus sp. LMS6]|uniref:hypothetical protein n=1 Tax=Alkalihalobacillus sp. LMS6 TaxID=2924034 RepID=UPI0020D085CA|nr:hypothetical protein [Alkalihalobacillus sp. LMS6]UTR04787.1 hypothetical protein MM326_11630 [Alkalihalobacillus sp. LMS6]